MTTTRRVHVANGRTRSLIERQRLAMNKKAEAHDAARLALHGTILAALDAGEPITAVADASGYTRQRLHQMVTGRT